MALGTNYKRIGRKQDLVLRIGLRLVDKLGVEATKAEMTKLYKKLTVDELVAKLKELKQEEKGG